MKAYGKKTWLIPDCLLALDSKGQLSHEAICVVNTSDVDAVIDRLFKRAMDECEYAAY